MENTDLDLYNDNLFGMPDTTVFQAVREFIRAEAPAMERMQEGYLVDFKAEWSDSALKCVAAFANTFGGILLVGVSEKDGRADAIVGVPSARQELKTSIASAIASNIIPTPPYDIRDLILPEDRQRRLCIVRVRKGNSLYLLTKKGEAPVYVRNEDESIRADAARLQSLLATRATPAHTASDFAGHLNPTLLPFFSVSENFEQGAPGQRRRSETFLQLEFLMQEPRSVRLDLPAERYILQTIGETYAGLTVSPSKEWRSRVAYQATYIDERNDYEMLWGISDAGALYFITQVSNRGPEDAPARVWSIIDAMTNIDWNLEIAHRFWNYLEYPGEGRILATLQVGKLPPLERGQFPDRFFAAAFCKGGGSRARVRPLSVDSVSRLEQQGERAFAAADFTYASRNNSRPTLIAHLTNQLLRDLGYAASVDALESVIST